MTFTDNSGAKPRHDVWRVSAIVAAILAALLSVLALIFFSSGVDTAFIASWTGVTLLGLTVAIAILTMLAHLVTPPGEAVSGSSIIAVAFAFAMASIASPLAVQSAAHGLDRLFGAAFDLTPTLVLRATNNEPLCPRLQFCVVEQSPPSAAACQIPAADSIKRYDATPPGPPAQGTTPASAAQQIPPPSPVVPKASASADTAKARDQRSLVKAEIISRIFSYIAHGESLCLVQPAKPTSSEPEQTPVFDPDIGSGARIWFMIVLGVGLLLGRTFAEARRDWYALQDREERETGAAIDGGPGDSAKRPIITYPKWIAATVYAAILAPASYLAIGALLFLSLDTATIDQAEFKNRLDAAETRAMSSEVMDKSDLGTAALLEIANASPEGDPQASSLATVRGAVLTYYGLQSRLDTLRRTEKQLMIEKLHEAGKTYAPSKVPDYADYLVETYYNSVLTARAKARTCLGALSPIQAVIGKRDAAGAANLTNLAKAKDLVDALNTKCPTPSSNVEVLFEDNRAPSRGSLIETVMFGWIIGMPKTTVLVIGLLGFGLFGAAIRMLGRPDHPEVLPQNDDDKTLQNMVKDLMERAAAVRADGGAGENESIEIRRKRLCEIAALKALTIQINALARQENAERNNVIYTRSEYWIDNEANLKVRERVALSSAPARVLVHGLGAAFTVFLMGEAGSRFFSEGGKTSPIGLVALCFIGAVFAEDIWRRAHEFLGQQISPSPPPTGGPSPPVKPGGTGGQNSPNQKATGKTDGPTQKDKDG